MPLSPGDISSRYLPDVSTSICIPHSYDDNLLADDVEDQQHFLFGEDNTLDNTPLPPQSLRNAFNFPLSPSRKHSNQLVSSALTAAKSRASPIKRSSARSKHLPAYEIEATTPPELVCAKSDENQNQLTPKSQPKKKTSGRTKSSREDDVVSMDEDGKSAPVASENKAVSRQNVDITPLPAKSEGSNGASQSAMVSARMTRSRTRSRSEQTRELSRTKTEVVLGDPVPAQVNAYAGHIDTVLDQASPTLRKLKVSPRSPAMMDDSLAEDSFMALPSDGIASRLIMYGQKYMDANNSRQSKNTKSTASHPKAKSTAIPSSDLSHLAGNKNDQRPQSSLVPEVRSSGQDLPGSSVSGQFASSETTQPAVPSLKRPASPDPEHDGERVNQQRKRVKKTVQPATGKDVVAPRPRLNASRNVRSTRVKNRPEAPAKARLDGGGGHRGTGTRHMSSASSSRNAQPIKVNSKVVDSAASINTGANRTSSNTSVARPHGNEPVMPLSSKTLRPGPCLPAASSTSSQTNIHPTKPASFTFKVDLRLEAGNKAGVEESKHWNMDRSAATSSSAAPPQQQQQRHRNTHQGPGEAKKMNPNSQAHLSHHPPQPAFRRHHITPIVPQLTEFHTDLRARQRREFDERVKEKERALQAELEERRRLKELEEEEEWKEARKRTVVKAHAVPEWYQVAPRKAEKFGDA